MIHYQLKEKHVLGVYVADAVTDPDSAIRQTLELENQKVLTPEEMYSVQPESPYILDATRKTVYSRSKFSGDDNPTDDDTLISNGVHIYVEKFSGRILVRVRHNLEFGETLEESKLSIEKTIVTLNERGFRPIGSRIEDIPEMCFV